MKLRLIIFLMFITCVRVNANDISKINKLKKNAEIAYEHKQFDVAVQNYSYLIDSMQVHDEEAILNLGHSYFQLGQKDMAQNQYQKLVLSENDELKSIAYQQLGAMSNDPKTLQKAMSYFKESIKSDPRNMDARYNYELVKKKLKDQKEKQSNDKDKNNDKNEPSDWAKELKQKAERLVELRKYREAHELMKDGLTKDPTVQQYSDFIERIGVVADINKI